jgi:acetolactate synthase-1/2/3 large subunit
MSAGESMSGGAVVARTLRELGTEIVFSVSGNQVLPIYDAAEAAGVRILHLRHESAAAYAALAYAEITGHPGVVLVSAGPGFLAPGPGLATAKSMELPVLFLAGAAATPEIDAGGFQDLDQTAVANVTCKASFAVTKGAELRAVIARAWQVAREPTPGPVHVSLPSDVLRATVRTGAPPDHASSAEALSEEARAALSTIAEQLIRAARPVIIARPSAGRGAAGRALERLARNLGIGPVITESPRGLGDLKYREPIEGYPASDCALVVAPADFAVGFLDRSAIATNGAVLLLDAPGDPTPRRAIDVRLQVAPAPALTLLADLTAGHAPRLGAWGERWSRRPPVEVERSPDGIHPLEVAHAVRGLLRPDDVVVLDGGEYCQWLRLGLRDLPNRVIWNGKLGGIGGAVPMALGVAAASPGGRVVAFAGDGAFGYHASELETAARYGLPLVMIVGNDARWGAEWHLQVSRYGRVYETTLLEAGYEQVAHGLGALGARVTESAGLGPAIAAALDAGRPGCINVAIASVRSPAVTH